MKVNYAIPVRGVEQLADHTFMLAGVRSDIFGVPAFPQQVPVTLFVEFVGAVHEAGVQHKLKVAILGPDMQPVGDSLETEFSYAASEHLPAGWAPPTSTPMQVLIPAEEPGAYSIEFWLNDAHSYSVPVYIKPA